MYKLHYSGLHLSSFRMGMLRLDATWQSYKIHNLLHTSLHLSSFSTDVPRHVALHCIALHCIALHCIALHFIALHCICDEKEYHAEHCQ